MLKGDTVVYRGGLYRLIAVDPVGVSNACAYLEELDTGGRLRAPVSEIVSLQQARGVKNSSPTRESHRPSR